MFESVNGRTYARTDGRRLDWYTISSPCEPSAQVSLKRTDPYFAMLSYRTTPIDDIGLSPAEMMFSPKLKTKLPMSAPLLPKNLKKRFKQRQEKQKQYHDRGSKALKPLKIGENVVMQLKKVWRPVTITEKHPSPRSYVVENENGQQYRRNRRHLRPSPARSQSETTSTPSTSDSVTSDQEARENDTTTTTTTSAPTQLTTTTYKTRSGRTVKMPDKCMYQDYVMK